MTHDSDGQAGVHQLGEEITISRAAFGRAYRLWAESLEDLEFPDLPAVPASGDQLFQILLSQSRDG